MVSTGAKVAKAAGSAVVKGAKALGNAFTKGNDATALEVTIDHTGREDDGIRIEDR